MIEEKRNELNLELRGLLSVLDIIDGKENIYADYKENTMEEIEFLNQQLELVKEAKKRLIDIFKD